MIPDTGKKQLKARPSTQKHLYVMGGGDSKYFHKYDIQSDSWDGLGRVNKRHRHACVYIDGKIIMIGGWNNRICNFETVTTVESFNVNTGEMKDLKPLEYPRANLTAVYLKNEIYALGGNADERYRALKTVEK